MNIKKTLLVVSATLCIGVLLSGPASARHHHNTYIYEYSTPYLYDNYYSSQQNNVDTIPEITPSLITKLKNKLKKVDHS